MHFKVSVVFRLQPSCLYQGLLFLAGRVIRHTITVLRFEMCVIYLVMHLLAF